MLLVVVILVLSLFKYVKLNLTIVRLLLILVDFCAITWQSMPWARRIKIDKKNKIISIIFISLALIICVLWIVAIMLGTTLYEKFAITKNASSVFAINVIKFIRIVIVFSVEVFVASFITSTLLKYGKEKIPFQVVLFASVLFLNYFILRILFLVRFNDEKGLEFADPNFFGKKLNWMFLCLAIVILLVSAAFNNRYEKNRQKELVQKDNSETNSKENKKDETVEKKLENLKALLDKNLISEKEYEEKKKDILDKI